ITVARAGLEPAAISGPSKVVPTFRKPFFQYIQPAATHFWSLANGVFSKGPKSGPKKGWLYANHVGSPRTKKRRFCFSFPGVTGVFPGIQDVGGHRRRFMVLGPLAT